MSIRLFVSRLSLALICLIFPFFNGAHATSTPCKTCGNGGFADIVAPLLPAVVNISTSTTFKSQGDLGQSPLDIPFSRGSHLEDFFKDFFDRMQPEGPRSASALGSGFIIDPSGYIVTNNHLVADADQITITLNDNTELKANLVGRDRRTDIALLKINTDKKLPFVQWGDSEGLRTGDQIIAIGNPFGLGGTVTTGIISHMARDIGTRTLSGDFIDGYIQTDASINIGNSGGPMFDINGKVVGVNTAIFSPTGASVGIGFAIPSEIARKVVDQLRQYGRTKRGWIGVHIQPVTEDIAEGLGLKTLEGALVGNVVKDGPAATAKLQSGDVILKVGDVSVKETRALPRIVGKLAVNSQAPFTIWRKGKVMTIPVQIGEYEEAEASNLIPSPRDGKVLPKGVTIHGMTFQSLTDGTRQQYGINEEAQGVLVVDVAPKSSAADKGIRPGDIVMEISQDEVNSPQDILNHLKDAEKENRKSALLLINRDGESRYVSIKLIPDGKES